MSDTQLTPAQQAFDLALEWVRKFADNGASDAQREAMLDAATLLSERRDDLIARFIEA